MSDEILTFDINEIMALIPHRYPFILVDRITECVSGKYCKGYKNVTINEEFFQGHFPNNPIMPGVLQVEALAQLSSGILMTDPKYKGKLALFAAFENVRFKHIVRPSDRLDMKAELLKVKGPIVKVHSEAYVDEVLTTQADFTIALQDRRIEKKEG